MHVMHPTKYSLEESEVTHPKIFVVTTLLSSPSKLVFDTITRDQETEKGENPPSSQKEFLVKDAKLPAIFDKHTSEKKPNRKSFIPKKANKRSSELQIIPKIKSRFNSKTTESEDISSAITPPIFDAAYLKNEPPSYPYVARQGHIQGKVVLKVDVTPQGSVNKIMVITSSGSGLLDQAAIDAVNKWHFVAARQGGASN